MTAAVAVATTSGADVDTGNHVESAWSKLKGSLLDAATKVSHLSKNHQRKLETWCWNEDVDKAIRKKRAQFKVYSVLKKGGMTVEAKEPPTAYINTKRMAKQTVSLTNSEAEKKSPQYPQMMMVFSILPTRWTTQTRTSLVRTVYTMMLVNLCSLMKKIKAWIEHCAKLFNVEFEWPSNELLEAPPIAAHNTDRQKLSKMKCSKVAGLSGIVVKMQKAAGDEDVELARQLAGALFSCGGIPSDRQERFIRNLYKGKGEALDRGNDHGLKITDQVMKPLKWVIHFYICKMVNIAEMRFIFVPCRGTTDTIFIFLQLQGKYIPTNKLLYFAFIDLEKAFSCVSRKVLW